jgi:hypothetical protein
MGPSAIMLAMPTPSLRSLGLGATRRGVPCRRPAHSGLVLLGHECVASWGTHMP